MAVILPVVAVPLPVRVTEAAVPDRLTDRAGVLYAKEMLTLPALAVLERLSVTTH